MSPFEIFRRNLKPLMVFLTALALFAFVVLPAMQTYLQQGGGGMADPQVAVFDGVPVHQSRVDYLTRNHQSTVRFLRELATETIRRGGSPQTPGFVYDTRSKQIQSIGINEQPTREGTIQTLLFTSEANRAGFELDDTAIKSWLNNFTDGTLSDSEILSLLMTSTRNQMGQYHLYEILRTQLLAGLYQNSAFSGVVDGQFPLMTPAEQWAAFLKINRKATVDSYGVLVNDYISQTNETPSETEIAEVYKEGIKRFPSEQTPEPGFRRRETASFEYLVADMKAFTDREVEEIVEDELKAEYERRLSGGDFQLPDMPAEEETPEATPDGPAAEEAGTEESDESAAKEEMKKEEAGEETKDEPATTESTEAADADDDAAENRDQVESFKKELDSVRDEAASEADADDQSRAPRASAVRLVALLQDESEDTQATEEKADQADSSEKKADAEKAETADADSEKAAPEKADEKAETNDKTAEEKKGDEAKTDDETPKDGEAADKTKADDGEEKASDEAKPDGDAGAEKKMDEEPKVETFEDVRERIAQALAGPPARKKIDAAVTEVTGVMRKYFNEKAIHDSNVLIGKEGDAPVKPDLKALAEKLGMEYQTVGPHDVASIADEPISQSSEVGAQIGRRGPSFVTMMFGAETAQQFIPKQQLYSPLRTADDTAGKVYVSWKTDLKEGYLPDLDEVRGEVIMAIRQSEARKLAQAAAEAIAEKVNAGEPLAEIIPEDKKDNLKEALGPFSWMNSFGFQGAFLGNVPELDSVGEDFMKAVFTSETGKAAVAANQPERVFYVVNPTAFQPHVDDLKQIFKQPQERIMALPLGSNEVRSILRGFYDSVNDRTGFSMAEEEQL